MDVGETLMDVDLIQIRAANRPKAAMAFVQTGQGAEPSTLPKSKPDFPTSWQGSGWSKPLIGEEGENNPKNQAVNILWTSWAAWRGTNHRKRGGGVWILGEEKKKMEKKNGDVRNAEYSTVSPLLLRIGSYKVVIESSRHKDKGKLTK